MPYTAKRPKRRRRPAARVLVPGRRGWKTLITIHEGTLPFHWIGAKGPVVRRPLSLVKPEREMRRAIAAAFSSALPRGLRQSGLLQRLAEDAERRAATTKQGPVGRGGQPLGEERTRILQNIFRYEDMEVVADLFANDRDAFEAEFSQVLQDNYLQLFETGGAAARRALGVRGSFDLQAPGVAQALEERANMLAGNVADDVFERLMTVIGDGFYLQGKSPLEVATALSAEFDWLTDSRARTIARTETGTVTEEAQWITYSATGVPYKRWLTTLDGKERDTHFEAHGQIRPIDEKFEVGDAELMHPLDPDGPPGEIINCRCTMVPVVTGDQELSEADVWNGDNEPDQFARQRERDPDQPPGLRPPDPSETDDLDFAFPEDEKRTRKRWFGFGSKEREYVRDEIGRFGTGGAGGLEKDPRFGPKADQAETGRAAVEIGVEGFDRQLPRITEGDTVGGLTLATEDVDNTSSIGAAFNDSIELGGIRAVPVGLFGGGPDKVGEPVPIRYYSAEGQRRREELRDEIKASGKITPLIVAMDSRGGPYILEGSTRWDALLALGVDSIPALVVFDDDDGAFSGEKRLKGRE